jgi:recombination protein RecT
MTKNALAPIDSFKNELKLMEPNFRPLLPANIRPEKFEALVIAAVSGNPELLKVNRESLWRACVQGAELGLSLNPTMGEADILVVQGGAQFRPRYKGLMKLALQSGEVTSIRSVLVYENDVFEVIEGLRRDIIHKPARGARGALTHVYCVWTLRGLSEPQFEVMDRQQVMRIKARSPAGSKGSGPWKTDEEEMWRKTVVRRASKYMPISCEAFVKAVAVDNFAEGGVEIDVTDGGEIIEVGVEEAVVESSQVDAIEDILPADDAPTAEPAEVPEYDRIEFGPTDTWDTWCTRAGTFVKSIPKEHRPFWGALHADLLAEAEEQKPRVVKRIRDLIGGAE